MVCYSVCPDPDAFGHRRLCFLGIYVSDSSLSWVPIRVVGSYGKRRSVDPSFPQDQASSWRLWIWEGRPLSELHFDPAEWQWPGATQGQGDVSFFEYTVRIGRIYLARHQRDTPTQMRSWLHAGLSHAYLRTFWRALWGLRIAFRILYFIWLVLHAGAPVGTWAANMGHDPVCTRCIQCVPESPVHCLWTCPASLAVWRAVTLLLSRAGLHCGFLTWGSVIWLMPSIGPHMFFQGEAFDPVFMLSPTGYHFGTLDMVPTVARQGDMQYRDDLFSVVVCVTMWNIWKARCLHVLSATSPPTQETLSLIWSDLIHTLRSQWGGSASGSRSAQERRLAFIRRWARSGIFFSLLGGHITWEYSPPRWFILHSSYFPP